MRDEEPRDARVVDQSSLDERFVALGAIAWLLVTVLKTEEEPTGGGAPTSTATVQRLNTAGGSAPATGCEVSGDLGEKAFVPYTADYSFYDDGTRHDGTIPTAEDAEPFGRCATHR
jgi:hypothetical protein